MEAKMGCKRNTKKTVELEMLIKQKIQIVWRNRLSNI